YQHTRMLFELGDAAVDAVERDLRPTPPALIVEVHALEFGGCHGSVFGEQVHDHVEHFLGCAARQVDCRYNRHGRIGTVRKLVRVHQVSFGTTEGRPRYENGPRKRVGQAESSAFLLLVAAITSGCFCTPLTPARSHAVFRAGIDSAPAITASASTTADSSGASMRGWTVNGALFPRAIIRETFTGPSMCEAWD